MRTITLALVLGLLVAAFVVVEAAQDQKNLDDLVRQRQQIDRATAAMDVLKKQVEVITAAKEYKCLAAFGSAPFCSCLANSLPISIEMDHYVEIVTTPHEAMGYDQFTADQKGLVDKTVEARDTCVAKVFRPFAK